MNKLDEIRDKVLSNSQLRSKIYEWTELNKSIVFTNGVFDIVHLGHIDYLRKAKDEGDSLLGGVNSDDSARKLGKGSSRPINNEISRSTIIAALQFVDAVILFSEDTPYNLIKLVQPDILVKGSDYMPENIVGYDIVMQKGGSIKTIDFLEGYSTTLIEKKIKYS